MSIPRGGDRERFNDLTGRADGPPEWITVCRNAVELGETTDLLADNGVDAGILVEYARSRWLRSDADPAGGTDLLLEPESGPDQFGPGPFKADYSAAKVLAHLACALAGAHEVPDACSALVEHCDRAGLRSVGHQVAVGPLPDGAVARVALRLWEEETGRARGYAVLAALALAGQRPARKFASEIPVLFLSQDVASGGKRRGEVGVLRLQWLAHGPSGFHPDPAWMAFTELDDAVIDGMATAWKTSRLATATDNPCVVWSVVGEHGGPPSTLTGASMTAAVAIALNDLAPRYPRLRQLRPHKLDPGATATAGLDSGLALTRVEGYDLKLKAAQRDKLRVIVADAELEAAREDVPERLQDQVVGAVTLRDAIERTRSRRNSTPWVAAVAFVLIVAALAAYAVAARRDAGAISDVALSRRAAYRAMELRRQDPALAQQLALAAYRIASTDEARAALVNIGGPRRFVTAPHAVTTSLDSTGALLALGYGDGIVRLLDRGRPHDGDVPAVKVAESLGALAFRPNSKQVAVGGDVAASVWDLSGERPAQPIVRLSGASGIRALAWSPDGTEVAAATDGGVVRWSVGEGEEGTLLPPLPQQPASPTSIAYSRDGRAIAVGNHGSVAVWQQGAEPVAIAVPDRANVMDLVFDPVGGVALMALVSGHTLLVDVEGRRAQLEAWGAAATPLESAEARTTAIAVGDDGSTFISGTAAGDITSAEGDIFTPLGASGGGFAGVDDGSFSADPTATDGGAEKTGELGSSEGPMEFDEPGGSSSSIMFGPAQSPVVSIHIPNSDSAAIVAYDDGTVTEWGTSEASAPAGEPSADDIVTRMCRDSASVITQAEWERYLPDIPYRNFC